MSALERLVQGVLRLIDEDQPPPCLGRRADRWTSEDAGERACAASVCVSLQCPLLGDCAAGAEEIGAKHFVWGGVDRTTVTGRRVA
jgi:hypothetical protein